MGMIVTSYVTIYITDRQETDRQTVHIFTDKIVEVRCRGYDRDVLRYILHYRQTRDRQTDSAYIY